ncbi:MAG TPA: transcription antitermination factor NusB [Fimbriimonadales bacterium]|jgi:N utilization substance protein B|nr:transcription antitermination factor NusB [Fimbriimonadales bacterium]
MAARSRRKSRRAAFKALYAIEVGARRPAEALEEAVTEAELSEDGKQFMTTLVNGVGEKIAEIDETLSQSAIGYSLDRMSAVDRAVLRIAVYELLYLDETPDAVAINEAVEIVKKYSSAESGGFVNGILGSVAKRKHGSST